MRTVTQASASLTARGISKNFSGVRALDGVDIDLPAGRVTALMGENGAGKSTLLKILSGDHLPDAGEIEIGGETVSFQTPFDARSAGLRVIAQEPEIVPHVSVAENIYLGALPSGRLGRVSQRAIEEQARQDLERFGFGHLLDPARLGVELSPAQRQIVEIVRCLIDEPQVICFDEPTSSLSDHETDVLFELIARLRDEGRAVGYVSHRMHEIFRIADTVTVLRDGRLIGSREVTDTTEGEIVKMMVGRDLTSMYDRDRREPGAPALELEDVTTDDVTGVSLTVHHGEVVALAGLVGAGRTELALAIAGDRPVRSGVIKVEGTPRQFGSPREAIAAGIALAPEERKADALVMVRTVRDNIALAVLGSLSRFGFVKARREKDLADRYIEQLHIRTPSAAQLVQNLSGGNQQKVVLARWLARDAGILILDEPTRGVDVGAKAEIYQIIDELASRGVAVLVISSELPEVLGLADRVVVMQNGRVTGELHHTEATEERILTLAIADHLSDEGATS
ncbi:sugar ABC transporter ATP-binding protein [Actinotalea sp. M2MS4P-6]|uniref:sugar ABC transporter ATP-binding protein n=1 Tax=Actinotalea sp. M2MS4P-6 TaxID=2983762 RepID=UPI0021E406C4|nr:sugar ABC transporter ATP-binding protein [Actinotalea sp. M2MS4P-6]MCV2395896.1 sugar ABC transporter ATP-binding protein [Actinotalea sp. M2MS4P-6]